MGLSFENTRPHTTLSIFRCKEDAVELAERVIGALNGLAATLDPVPSRKQDTDPYVSLFSSETVDGAVAYGAWYRIEKSPAWFKSAAAGQDDDPEEEMELLDLSNHLVIVVAYRSYVALFASQDNMRSRLNELIETGVSGEEKKAVRMDTSAEPLTRDEIEQAFVRGNTKNAWLQGLHAPTILKADRKIMSGPDLRYALDHFEDQTFTYTAAVSELALDGAPPTPQKGKAGYRVGVSHSKYTIWTKPTKKFGQFIGELKEIVSRLDGAVPDRGGLPEVERAGVPFVAHPIQSPDLTKLVDGFDVAYEPPDTSDEEILRGEVVVNEARTDLWQTYGSFVVDPDAKVVSIRPYEVLADAFYSDRHLAKLRFRPIARADFTVEVMVSIEEYIVGKDDPDIVALDRSLARRNSYLTLRYSSGHVIQGGKLFSISFRDVIFGDWIWKSFGPAPDGRNYDVGKEKPTKKNADQKDVYAPDQIGKQDSLFCYVFNNVRELIYPHGDKEWRLLCDDGSGELADFIVHIPEVNTVIFIHIKAWKKKGSKKVGTNDSDGSKGAISVTPFSEVVIQATKNLRFFDSGVLIKGLKERTTDSNQSLVWQRNGKKMTRDKFIEGLESVPRPNHRQVIILQPRIWKDTWDRFVADHEAGKESADVGRMRQLSAVLSNQLEGFRKLEATLKVVGQEDQTALKASPSSSSPIKSATPRSARNRRAKASR